MQILLRASYTQMIQECYTQQISLESLQSMQILLYDTQMIQGCYIQLALLKSLW